MNALSYRYYLPDISGFWPSGTASGISQDKITSEPVETILSNFMGMKHLLDFAKEQDTKILLLISSSEVYGIRQHDWPRKTDDCGRVVLLDPGSSYSIGKCDAGTVHFTYKLLHY